MNKLAIALTAILALPVAANAAPCRNAQGHFVKCPPAAPVHAAPAVRAATMTQAMPVARSRPVRATAAHPTAARKAPCRDATGRFKKC
jgi:hypothetical protein